MATKKTCICIGDLEERRAEISCAVDIIAELETNKNYYMLENKDGSKSPYPGEETRVRLYNEIIKSIIENYG